MAGRLWSRPQDVSEDADELQQLLGWGCLRDGGRGCPGEPSSWWERPFSLRIGHSGPAGAGFVPPRGQSQLLRVSWCWQFTALLRVRSSPERFQQPLALLRFFRAVGCREVALGQSALWPCLCPARGCGLWTSCPSGSGSGSVQVGSSTCPPRQPSPSLCAGAAGPMGAFPATRFLHVLPSQPRPSTGETSRLTP